MTATPLGYAASLSTTLAAGSWSTSLLSLANGTASTSPAIDNTVATLTDAAYDTADLLLDLGASTALGASGFPSLSAVVLLALDGTNYQTALVSGTQLYPLQRQRIWSSPASVSQRIIVVPGLPLAPAMLKIAIINNLGAALPSSGVVATLYRYRGQSG